MGASPLVRVYTAAGCHLCDEAVAAIELVALDTPLALERVDITGRPELERRYRSRIPVVLVDGEELFSTFVEPERLRKRLAQSH